MPRRAKNDADRERSREYANEVRAERKAAGLCQVCGKNPADQGHTRCIECKKTSKQYREKRNEEGRCYQCNGPKEENEKTCRQCKDANAERAREDRKKLRAEVYNVYGGFHCSCPGCSETDPAFLTLDHINDDGAYYRKVVAAGHPTYLWLKQNGYPPIVRVMCFNCNAGRYHNGGHCPHLEQMQYDAHTVSDLQPLPEYLDDGPDYSPPPFAPVEVSAEDFDSDFALALV